MGDCFWRWLVFLEMIVTSGYGNSRNNSTNCILVLFDIPDHQRTYVLAIIYIQFADLSAETRLPFLYF